MGAGVVLKSASWSDCPLCTFARDRYGDEQLLSQCMLHEKIDALSEDISMLSRIQHGQDDQIKRLLETAQAAYSALDNLMGDSDLPEDDSLEARAMELLSAVIAEHEEP